MALGGSGRPDHCGSVAGGIFALDLRAEWHSYSWAYRIAYAHYIADANCVADAYLYRGVSDSNANANMHRGVPHCNAIADSYGGRISHQDTDADPVADSYGGRISHQDTDADRVADSDGYYTDGASNRDLL